VVEEAVEVAVEVKERMVVSVLSFSDRGTV
jgi:hypothetical protein